MSNTSADSALSNEQVDNPVVLTREQKLAQYCAPEFVERLTELFHQAKRHAISEAEQLTSARQRKTAG